MVGEVARGMASRAACRVRRRESHRAGAKNFQLETPPGTAEIYRNSKPALIRGMQSIRVPAFAKVNLRLDVLTRRADGYHELRTIFQSISLRDELRMRATRGPGISLTVSGNDALSRESVQNNLVYKAVTALVKEIKVR